MFTPHCEEEASGMYMTGVKEFIVYVIAISGGFMLYGLSESWFGKEWIFGLLAVVWYGVFLLVWKRLQRASAGLIVVTVFMLMNINSIFFVQYTAMAICSLLMGLLLVPFYRSHRDVALTSAVFVLMNIVTSFELGSIASIWMVFVIAGFSALAGARYRFSWLKGCFTVIFAMAGLLLLLGSLVDHMYLIALLIAAAMAALTYKFVKQPAT